MLLVSVNEGTKSYGNWLVCYSISSFLISMFSLENYTIAFYLALSFVSVHQSTLVRWFESLLCNISLSLKYTNHMLLHWLASDSTWTIFKVWLLHNSVLFVYVCHTEANLITTTIQTTKSWKGHYIKESKNSIQNHANWEKIESDKKCVYNIYKWKRMIWNMDNCSIINWMCKLTS